MAARAAFSWGSSSIDEREINPRRETQARGTKTSGGIPPSSRRPEGGTNIDVLNESPLPQLMV